ncbi:hypothetical protein BC834DRAFT_848155 [Gloeopeniophorella convolvens]|nr:hypothetical protein BC834DRAFT_848155 [Gloeopeniophorella convolvens]
MYFSAAFVLAALPFLVEAAPFTSTSGGLSVPIAKRSSLLNADGTVNATVLRGSLRNSVAKIHKGFAAFEKNVGEVHPLAASLKSPVKRDGAGDPLTDDNAQLWYGAISVGTPAKTYTVPCNFNTPVSVTFGGKEFKVDPKTFSLGPADQGGSDCVAGLASDDSIGSQFWIFGDVFLQNVYTAFDVGKSSVGFAELAAELAAGVEGGSNLAVAGEEASEMVPNDLPDEEHERLDKEEDVFYALTDPRAAKTPDIVAARHVLTRVVGSCDLLDSKYDTSNGSKNNVTQLLEEHPWLISLVQKCCAAKTARKLRLLMVLRSWDLPYQGNAARVLLDIISDYLKKRRVTYDPLASIINASGTGKSRMVDELAKTIISVPMCLRDAGSKGVLDQLEFAGKTWTVNDMLAGKYKPSEQSERQNAAGFLTRRQERLASAFRHLMTHGQEFDSTNDYRQGFFKDIIRGANTLSPREAGGMSEERFGSLYDSAETNIMRNQIYHLAKQKILGGRFTVDQIMRPFGWGHLPSEDTCALASLAIRFALDFNPTTARQRDSVLWLVERHMRLCISATEPGLEARLSTTSSSEPLLARAAQEILSEMGRSPVHYLASTFAVPYIDHGDRGELAALLILMAARDKAASMSLSRGVISVCDFLEALMPESAYAQLNDARPVLYRGENENKPLLDAFEDSQVWFNHVIKVHDLKMLSSHELWKFVTRGAMILCANNQRAVDIVIPFCYSGDVLSRKTVSAIFIQVKIDDSFGPNPDSALFNTMDLFCIQVYKEGETPLPFIWMVFALASRESAVHIMKPDPTRLSPQLHGDAITPYDIWFAGMGPGTFPIVGDEQEKYKVVLQRSLPDAKAAYKASDSEGSPEVNEARENIRRNFTPLCEIDPAHNAKYRSLEEIAA